MECVLGYSVRFRYFFEEFSVFGRKLGDRTLVLAHLANEVEVVVGVWAFDEFGKGGELVWEGVREDVLLVGLSLVGLKGSEVLHFGAEIYFYAKDILAFINYSD